jgi:hypothetical protein
MWPAFPTSDYYEGSVPPQDHQSTTDLPATALAGRRGGQSQDGSHVHHAPVDGGGAQLCSCSLATGTPQAFPVASPPAFGTGFGVDHPRWSCTADRPSSTRLEPASRLRSFTHWVKLRLHLPVSLAGPGPSGGTDPSRRCRGCSHPPLRPQVQAAPSFKWPAATGQRWSPFTSTRYTAPRGAPECRARTTETSPARRAQIGTDGSVGRRIVAERRCLVRPGAGAAFCGRGLRHDEAQVARDVTPATGWSGTGRR